MCCQIWFIIVDRDICGMRYGRKLIDEAIKYAENELNVKKINLGVFSNNDNAYNCYKAVGFKIIGCAKDAHASKDEMWDCIEMMLDA